MGKKKRKQEQRQDQGFTDAFISAALAGATGEAAKAATAAREVCAGLYERAFASARVEPDTPETRALTVECLGMIGRSFVQSGEALFYIDADPTDGTVTLEPSNTWDVRGSMNPATWRYRANFAGPDTHVTRMLAGASVLHFKYAVEPIRPWRGVGPLALADTTTRIEQGISKQLADESGRSSGYVGTVPVGVSDESYTLLKTKIPTLRGQMALLESGGTWDSTQQGNRPGMDVTRIGADPPASVLNIWQFATSLVLAACGVPIELLQLADGTGNRESWRRFIFSTIKPTGRRVEAELSDKLDMDVKLNFDELAAADISGRARAFQSMVGGGMALEKAANLSGLMEPED